jgi:hypothetical protein
MPKMKRLIALTLPLLLSGCMIVDAFLMTKYDPNEYNAITDIRIKAIRYIEDCDNKEQAKLNAVSMAHAAEYFQVYSQHIPRNDNGYNAAKALNEMAQGLKDRYQKGSASSTFCKVKYKHIKEESEKIQHVIGARPR